jgi:hypothetical protein
MQSKRHSIAESVLNILSGSCIAYTITQIGSFVGAWAISPGENLSLTCILTVVSVVRSYFWRRVFNKHVKRKYKRRNSG